MKQSQSWQNSSNNFTRTDLFQFVICLCLINLVAFVWCIHDYNKKKYKKECISKAKIISWLDLSPEDISAEDACAADVIYTNQEIKYDFDGMVIIERGHKGTVFITPGT